MSEFKARFTLFSAQEKKSERSPDHSGDIEIAQAEIAALREYLMNAPVGDNYKGEPVVRLRIAGWNTESKAGRKYTSGFVTAPQPKQQPDATSNEGLPF